MLSKRLIANFAILFLSLFAVSSLAFAAPLRATHFENVKGELAQSSSATPLIPTATKVGVTPQGYDDMKKIIDSLGYESTEIQSADLTDYNKIKDYNVIFINCAAETDTYAAQAASALKQFVQSGGAIYASDFANSYMMEAFTDKINFYNVQSKTDYNSPRVGNVGETSATVVDSGLAQVLGKSSLKINFDLGGWVVIKSVASDVTVHITGEAPITGSATQDPEQLQQQLQEFQNNPEKLQELYSQSSQTLSGVPFVVSFSYGKGEVIYTSFHNEAQVSEDVKKMLDWFVIRARASSLASTARALASKTAGKGSEMIQEVVDTFQKGSGTKSYKLEIENAGNFSSVLLSESGILKLKISGPKGDNLGEMETKSPATISVKNAQKGSYTLEVSEVNLDKDKVSFALSTVGTPQPKKYTPVAENGSTTTPASSESFFRNLIKKALIWLVVGVVIFILVIVLIIWLIIRAAGGKKNPPASTPAPPTEQSTPKK